MEESYCFLQKQALPQTVTEHVQTGNYHPTNRANYTAALFLGVCLHYDSQSLGHDTLHIYISPNTCKNK